VNVTFTDAGGHTDSSLCREERASAREVPRPVCAGHDLGSADNVEEEALGAEGVLPGGYIESLLRVFKQLTHTLPGG